MSASVYLFFGVSAINFLFRCDFRPVWPVLARDPDEIRVVTVVVMKRQRSDSELSVAMKTGSLTTERSASPLSLLTSKVTILTKSWPSARAGQTIRKSHLKEVIGVQNLKARGHLSRGPRSTGVTTNRQGHGKPIVRHLPIGVPLISSCGEQMAARTPSSPYCS